MAKRVTLAELMSYKTPGQPRADAPTSLAEKVGVKLASILKMGDPAQHLRLVIGDIVLKGLVETDTPAATTAIPEEVVQSITASIEASLKDTIRQQTEELKASLEFTQKQMDDSLTAQDALRKEVVQIKRQGGQHQPQASDRRDADSTQCVLLAGLVDESTEGQQLVDTVQNFLVKEVNPAKAIKVSEVQRMGHQEEGRSPRRLKVILSSAAEAEAVIRAAKNLKAFNAARKQQGQTAVGLDPFLSKEDLKQKQALMHKWLEARKAGTRPYWRGCRLFVGGKEVQP